MVRSLKYPRLLIAFAMAALSLVVFYRTRPVPPPPDPHEAFFRTHPAAYANSVYYSTAFLDERIAAPHALDADYFEHLGDIHGTWVNVTNGWRATTGQPAGASHTVWMFGNSTLAAQE